MATRDLLISFTVHSSFLYYSYWFKFYDLVVGFLQIFASSQIIKFFNHLNAIATDGVFELLLVFLLHSCRHFIRSSSVLFSLKPIARATDSSFKIASREELPSTVFFLPRGGSTSTRSIGLLALPVNDRSMRIVAMTERQLSGGIGLLAPYHHHHPSSHSTSAVCDHKTSSKQTAESVVVLCCPTAASVCYSSILPTVLKLAPVVDGVCEYWKKVNDYWII